MKLTRREFEDAIVAQADDNDFSESGYAVCVFPGDKAAIFNYDHCSCYGTWEDLTATYANGYTEDDHYDHWDLSLEAKTTWEGTLQELIGMAERCADPAMPERKATEEDYDYKHLVAVYARVLAKYRTAQ